MNLYSQIVVEDFKLQYQSLEEPFEYVSIDKFLEMTDYQRTKYISDLHLYEMRFK